MHTSPSQQILKTLEPYQGLIFDMDGTLIDSMPAHLAAWEITAQHYHFPFDNDWLYSLGGMPGDSIVELINQKYALQLDPLQVSQFRMETFAQFNNSANLITVTNQILNYYYQAKKLAVGTGSPRSHAIPILKQTGLFNKLDAIATASDVSKHKPHPDTFLLAAQQMGLAPTSCIVFEDTLLGMQAAHQAGMHCFLLENNQLTLHLHDQNTTK